MRKVWKKKGTTHDPKHPSFVKHGEHSVMAWTCMAATGTGSLLVVAGINGLCVDFVCHLISYQ